MKKLSRILFLAASVSLFTAVESHAQIEVSIRPVAPRERVVVRRPPPPSPRHVWVDEGWKVEGHSYVYMPAHWAIPPHGRIHWIAGHWRETPRHRSVWEPGHWR